MSKDQLFLLPAAFHDPALGPGTFHCTECARIEGLLSYQPALREQIDVHHVSFARPRAGLVDLLGEPHQNCPTLVAAARSPETAALLKKSTVTDGWYCTGVDEVTAYLSAIYGVSAPHP